MECEWYLWPPKLPQINRKASSPFSQCLYEKCSSPSGKFIKKNERECYEMYRWDDCVYKKITEDGRYVGEEVVFCDGIKNKFDSKDDYYKTSMSKKSSESKSRRNFLRR
mmetsp:Transcript_30115/g.61139  ORF Transcript_30115/g.61139 Transcript_30115/m.61139 type:complete len:109 (-) Transcript_30115:326-652(-)